jgi:hypothetical protein
LQKARGRRLGTSTQEDTQRSHEMIGRLLSKEETNAALVVALSGTINGAGGQGAGFPLPWRAVVRGAVEPGSPPDPTDTRRRAHPGAAPADRRLRAT